MGRVSKALSKTGTEGHVLTDLNGNEEEALSFRSDGDSVEDEDVDVMPDANPADAASSMSWKEGFGQKGFSFSRKIFSFFARNKKTVLQEEGIPQDLSDKFHLFNNDKNVAKSLRSIRTKILHPDHGRPYKNILVTSAGAGAGKSTVCASLALTLSKGIEQHALLVDCDLRMPTLASLLDVSNEVGLVDYLVDGKDLSVLIQKTDFGKLSILPSGPKPINPSELIGSQKMEALLNELVSRYQDRFLVLDSPPLHIASETAVLCKYVDGVVLVVRWGGTDRKRVKDLVDEIGKDKIIGVVFNACEKNFIEGKIQKRSEYQGYY